MDNGTIFLGLSVIIVFGVLIAFCMRLIGQPLIIGHIITGMIIGPSVIKFVHSPEIFAAFSEIGITLLLFIIGLGLNPQVIREVGRVATIVGLVQVVATTIIGYFGGLTLGLTGTNSIILGVTLSFSSTIIILKLLADKKESMRLYGKMAIGITLVQDIVATIALLVLSAKKADTDFSLNSFGILAIKGVAIAYGLYFITRHILPHMQRIIAGNQEFLFMFSIGCGFGSAALFQVIGFSQEVGALLAGVMLASLPYSPEVASRLRPLRDFFVVLFFVTLGAGLQFKGISHVLPVIIFGVVVAAVVKPLIALVTLGLMGYTKRTSFKAALTSGQVSEFSIVFIVLSVKQGLATSQTVTTVTVVALVSIAISSYLITYLDKVYQLLENRLNLFERAKPRREHERQNRYDFVLFGYQKGGHEFLKVFQQLKKPYVVVDYDPDMIDAMEHKSINHVYGDASDAELLEEIKLSDAKLIVSMMSDHQASMFLLNFLQKHNPNAVVIALSETPARAIELYNHGASYVMLPHYLGSEKISAFIKKAGTKKSEFKKIREKHLEYLEAQLVMLEKDGDHQKTIGHTILAAISGK